MYSASTLASLCQARFAPDRKQMSGRHVHVLPLHSGNAALAEGTMICVQSELGPQSDEGASQGSTKNSTFERRGHALRVTVKIFAIIKIETCTKRTSRDFSRTFACYGIACVN